MREAAIMLHAPHAETCIIGQAIRACESITDVWNWGWSASMALRYAYRGCDRQVRHRDALGLFGYANPGNVLISQGSICIGIDAVVLRRTLEVCACSHPRITGRGTIKNKDGLRRSTTPRGHKQCNTLKRFFEHLY